MPAGRKSLYTEERVKEIETSLSLGLTDKDAARSSGISEDTFARWQAKYADFAERVTRAKANRVKTWMLLLRQNAMAGDTRAITELLDRCAPDYRKTERYEHTGKDGAPLTLVINRPPGDS
jgi:hypothetical protein